MAFVHGSVNDMSALYLANERRYNYTTPKSFLELVSCVCVCVYVHACIVESSILHCAGPSTCCKHMYMYMYAWVCIHVCAHTCTCTVVCSE